MGGLPQNPLATRLPAPSFPPHLKGSSITETSSKGVSSSVRPQNLSLFRSYRNPSSDPLRLLERLSILEKSPPLLTQCFPPVLLRHPGKLSSSSSSTAGTPLDPFPPKGLRFSGSFKHLPTPLHGPPDTPTNRSPRIFQPKTQLFRNALLLPPPSVQVNRTEPDLTGFLTPRFIPSKALRSHPPSLEPHTRLPQKRRSERARIAQRMVS